MVAQQWSHKVYNNTKKER